MELPEADLRRRYKEASDGEILDHLAEGPATHTEIAWRLLSLEASHRGLKTPERPPAQELSRAEIEPHSYVPSTSRWIDGYAATLFLQGLVSFALPWILQESSSSVIYSFLAGAISWLVSLGLFGRNRWAWFLSQLGLSLVVLLALAYLIVGGLQLLLRIPLEEAFTRNLYVVALAFWAIPNYIYFMRRRALFT